MFTCLKAGLRRLPMLIFVLLLPLCACAATGNPDDPLAAAPIHTAGGLIQNEVVTTAEAKTVADKLMTMKTPANVLELIENLYEVHRSRIAFDEAFYTEDNIRKITSGTGADINVTHNQEEKRISIYTANLRSIAGDASTTVGNKKVDDILMTMPPPTVGPEMLENEARVYNSIPTADFRSFIPVDLGADEDSGISVEIRLTIKQDSKKHVRISTFFSHLFPSLYYPAIEKIFSHVWQQQKPRPLGSNEVYLRPADVYGNNRMEYTRQDGNVVESGRFRFQPAGILIPGLIYTRRNNNE